MHILLKTGGDSRIGHTVETERAFRILRPYSSSNLHLIKQIQNLHCKSFQTVKFSIFIKKKTHQI